MRVKAVHTSVCGWEASLICLLIFSGSWKKTLELPSTQAEDLGFPLRTLNEYLRSSAVETCTFGGTLKLLWGERRRRQTEGLNIQEVLLAELGTPETCLEVLVQGNCFRD